MITPAILRQVAPRVPNPAAVCNAINVICPQYGINTNDILHEFLANVLEECGEFTVFAESLNYSPERLRQVFGRNRISDADANRFGRTPGRGANQVQLANILYGGEFGRRNLGNTQPGDGWAFRGSGPIQVTGRHNTTEFAKYYNRITDGKHTPEQVAHLMRTDLSVGMHSACWVFAISKRLIQAAIDDDMTGIIRRINGGLTNQAKRMEYYNALKRLLP
jgi:putative chitinase